MRSPDQIKKLIKNLLARAHDPATTEGEAVMALERVQALLAEHQLTLNDFGEVASKVEKDDLVSKVEPWARCLYDACARYFFCGYMVSEFKDRTRSNNGLPYTKRDRHVFFGEEHQVVSAQVMSKYLVATVKRLADEAARGVERGERVAFVGAFRAACSIRIARRLVEKMRSAQTVGITFEGTTLPALLSEYEKAQTDFQQHVKRYSPNAVTVASGGVVGHKEGGKAGRSAGDAVSLDPQLARRSQQQIR